MLKKKNITISVLFLLYIISTVTTLVSLVEAGKTVEGTLEAGDILDKPYVVKFTLKNVSPSKDLIILKWGTPLDEDITSQLFKVKDQHNQLMVYSGPMLNRDVSVVRKRDVIRLRAGKTRSAMVDLSKSYGFSQGKNTIMINFEVNILTLNDSSKLNVAETNADTQFSVLDIDLYPLTGQLDIDVPQVMKAPNIQQQQHPYRQQPAEKKSNRKKKSNNGLSEDDNSDKRGSFLESWSERAGLSRATVSTDASTQSVLYYNCSAKQKTSLVDYVAQAKKSIDDAVTYLGLRCDNDARYEKWFGKSDERSRRVYYTIRAVQDYMPDFRVDCAGGNECKFGVLAYVYGNDRSRTMYICKLFHLQSSGLMRSILGSPAGTVVHELTHFEGTQDHAYGDSSCRQLARRDVARAIENADSFTYFINDGPFPTACPSKSTWYA